MIAVVLAAGCAASTGAAGGDPVAAAEAALAGGQPGEARRILETVALPDGRVHVTFGDVWRSLGRDEQAVAAYWEARSATDSDVRARANCALGEIAHQRGDQYLAIERFRTAESDVVDARIRDRIIMGQAGVALARGEVAEARKLRARIAGSAADLAVLDAQLKALEAPKPVAEKTTDKTSALARGEKKPTARKLAVAAPSVLGRTRWKARGIRARGRPQPMGRVTRITLHHTASKRLPGTTQSSNAHLMRTLQADHQDGRGWADLGYHYVIDRQGRVWQGRNIRWQGAHAGNGPANRNNVGIALVGDFDRYAPSPSQRRSLKHLVRWLSARYDVSPTRIAGHRHVLKAFTGGGTACPGRHLASYLGELRRAVRSDRRRTVGM